VICFDTIDNMSVIDLRKAVGLYKYHIVPIVTMFPILNIMTPLALEVCDGE